MLTPPPPIPLTLVTGFLGAGKTTFLNQLLKAPELAETVVLVNEFGEVGLDHLLMEGIEDGMILMESGCLCCTIRGELITMLEDLLRRRDNGRIAPFKRLIIETTGLADPAPILNVVIAHPYLALRYQTDGVVTLVDAVNGMATLDAHAEALRQVVVADTILLTKTDLADRGQVEALRGRVGRLNPGVAVVDMQDGPVAAARILGLGRFDIARKPQDVQDWLSADAASRFQAGPNGQGNACNHDHHTHGHHDLGSARHGKAPAGSSETASGQDANPHDLNRHDARIRAFVLTADEPVRLATFELFWTLLRSTHGPRLLRLKGLVCIMEHPERPLVVHAVQSVLHPPVTLPQWPSNDHRSRLVLIVDDIDPALVERLWAAFLGQPASTASPP